MKKIGLVLGTVLIVILWIYGPLFIKYDINSSIENGDVVDVHGEIYNIHTLDNFATKVKAGEATKIRVVYITIEGDPILLDLVYKNGMINAKFDTKRDNYGSFEIRKVIYTGIEINVINHNNKSYRNYNLINENEEWSILHFPTKYITFEGRSH